MFESQGEDIEKPLVYYVFYCRDKLKIKQLKEIGEISDNY